MNELSKSDFTPGIVVYFDQIRLEENDRIRKTCPQPDPRKGPFLCVELDADGATWTPITTEAKSAKYERLRILKEWRSGGPPAWQEQEQFVNDGANLYQGAHDEVLSALSDASDGSWASAARAMVSAEGLKAVRAEIEKQRHRRLNELT
jgi:hypothetical protein